MVLQPIRHSLRRLLIIAVAVILVLCAILASAPGSTTEAAKPRFTTVVIDAGHGGHDRGAIRPIAGFEKSLTLDVAKRLEKELADTPLRSVSKEFVARHPHRDIGVHAMIADSARAFTAPRTRVWPAYEKEFNAAMQRMWRLEVPAETMLAEVERVAQARLDEAREQRVRRGKG